MKKQTEVVYREKIPIIFVDIISEVDDFSEKIRLILSGEYGVYDIKLRFINSKSGEYKEKEVLDPLLPQHAEITVDALDIDFEWDSLELFGKTQFSNIKIRYIKQKGSRWLKIAEVVPYKNI